MIYKEKIFVVFAISFYFWAGYPLPRYKIYPLAHGMIGAQNKSFPTKFAIQLATYCGLYVPVEEETDNEELWYDLRDRLAEFQKMAIACDFDTSMIAYFDMKDELSEAQLEILQTIHSKTSQWLMGHVGAVMLDNLELTSRSNNKDKQAIAEMFLEHFINKSADPGRKREKSMLVRFASGPSDAEIEAERKYREMQQKDSNDGED